MKKLIVLFVGIFCGALFAAAEGDAGASVSPQRISHPLTNLPKEIVQEFIFPHLSAKDQQAFRSVNSEARLISPRALTFNMSTVQDHEISRVSTFLADRKDIKTLKIIRLKAPLLIPALTSLQDGVFRFASLTILGLRYNGDVIPVLQNIIPLAPNLMGLNVGSCGLGAEDANLIRQMIPYLTTLNIWDNHIGAIGAAAIAQMPHLRTLNIGGNFIGAEGANAVAQMPHLRNLSISSNEIGDVGAAAIGRMPNLVQLSINQNNIGDAGAVAIAQILHLKTLDIELNLLGDAGAVAISQMPNLRILYIRRNFIGYAGQAALDQMIHLETLNR